jgi:hypothetical protein
LTKLKVKMALKKWTKSGWRARLRIKLFSTVFCIKAGLPNQFLNGVPMGCGTRGTLMRREPRFNRSRDGFTTGRSPEGSAVAEVREDGGWAGGTRRVEAAGSQPNPGGRPVPTSKTRRRGVGLRMPADSARPATAGRVIPQPTGEDLTRSAVAEAAGSGGTRLTPRLRVPTMD